MKCRYNQVVVSLHNFATVLKNTKSYTLKQVVPSITNPHHPYPCHVKIIFPFKFVAFILKGRKIIVSLKSNGFSLALHMQARNNGSPYFQVTGTMTSEAEVPLFMALKGMEVFLKNRDKPRVSSFEFPSSLKQEKSPIVYIYQNSNGNVCFSCCS